MSKLYGIKDWILLTAAVSVDAFQEIRLVGDLIPSLVEARYGFLPPNFKKESYFSYVSRLLKTGDINKKLDKKGTVYLELTSQGKKNLIRRFPIFFKAKWDGTFMVVVFDIPEETRRARDDLREKLKELGFGKLQESVWISPYHFEEDLKEFLQETGYLDYVFVMRATRILGKSLKEKAGDIWRLKDLNSEYEKIILEADRILKGESDVIGLKKIWDGYFKVLAKDPILPSEFLPSDWKRKDAYEMLQNLSHTLIKNTRSFKNNQCLIMRNYGI